MRIENDSHLLLLWLMVEVALPGGTDKVGKVAGTELEVKKVVSKMFATSCKSRYFQPGPEVGVLDQLAHPPDPQ